MKKVFVDGSAGTTGLRIVERLNGRTDIEWIRLPESQRKDPQARRQALNAADIVFLCLPDAAAVEAMNLLENDRTVVIDTSTAHRVDPDWTYGFAEIAGRRAQIASAHRIANPGCHASGFIALVAPLVEKGVLSAQARLTCYSLTGYSGGGKKMIAQYEQEQRDVLLDAPRMYGLSQNHKHLPEMKQISGLANAPIFCPVVAPYYAGMEVTVPVFASDLAVHASDLAEIYAAYYADGLVHFCPQADEDGFLSASAMQGRDDMQISVSGNSERILLTARFDNLGKGASGAAIQNMNLVLGLPQATGLCV